VKNVEHVYFYQVAIAEPPQLAEYLRQARQLGRGFAEPSPAVTAARTES
jgi:hypothetical protein